MKEFIVVHCRTLHNSDVVMSLGYAISLSNNFSTSLQCGKNSILDYLYIHQASVCHNTKAHPGHSWTTHRPVFSDPFRTYLSLELYSFHAIPSKRTTSMSPLAFQSGNAQVPTCEGLAVHVCRRRLSLKVYSSIIDARLHTFVQA